MTAVVTPGKIMKAHSSAMKRRGGCNYVVETNTTIVLNSSVTACHLSAGPFCETTYRLTLQQSLLYEKNNKTVRTPADVAS